MSESQLIIPQLPSGSLPAGKTLFIETRYYVITPDEPDYHKQAKQKANQQLCDAVKTFGWVAGIGTPPDWSRLRFSRDNNGEEWPATRINR
ncbi:MAG: hypothetical protein HY747_05775 [Elusimicrobia bacterium]|nr:hypothetical protein [Elusimicrobiota bacterium]